MAIADTAARPRPHPLSKLLGLLVLVGLTVTVATVLASAQSPVSCKYHRGSFSNDFSTDFDISRVDCRSTWMKDSPTIHFWAARPYVGLEWSRQRNA